jgi:hypothetical protein|tara:strand:+ start:574 stop:2313 length:1740 start_codon:yes stop_codon:yes gene_type:complete
MIIPTEFPYSEDPSRDAERIVFNKLKVVFGNEKNFDIYYNREIWSPYNPNIPEQVEGDFILFHDKAGFLVIEVKGGNPIEFVAAEDQWYSTSRHGNRYKINNPFKQANKIKWAIKERIKEKSKGKVPNINAKILVIFPDSGMPNSLMGVEYDRSNIVSISEIDDLSNIVMKTLLNKDRDPRATFDSPGQQCRKIFQDMFAKSFKLELSLKDKLNELNKKIIKYDKHQIEILDQRKEPRLIIEGRAGTGKSLLAVEKAKRFSKKLEKILLICGANRPFAKHMIRELEKNNNIYVNYFSGLCKNLYDKANFANDEVDEIVTNTKKYPKDRYLNPYEIHQLMLEKAIEKTGIKFDALVVDEGQDINKSQWDSLLMILIDPFKSPVYIFHDNNQKIYHKSKLDLPDFPKYPHLLDKNYRNTKYIFNTQKSYYEGETTISVGPDGESVRYVISNDLRDTEKKIIKLINKYTVNEGISKKEIAILTGNKYGIATTLLGNYYSKHDSGSGLTDFIFVKAEDNHEDAIVLDSIKRFKGLERDVVILFDLEDAFDNPEEMYTGLSRPKLILDIFVSERGLEILKKISE